MAVNGEIDDNSPKCDSFLSETPEIFQWHQSLFSLGMSNMIKL